MTLFDCNDAPEAIGGGCDSSRMIWSSQRKAFSMPTRGITPDLAAEAVRVLCAEVGRPVTSKEVKDRFDMSVFPAAYLLRAYEQGILDRSPRAPTDGDRSLFTYEPTDVASGTDGQWMDAMSAAGACGVDPSTIRRWGRSGKIKRRGSRGNMEYLVKPQSQSPSATPVPAGDTSPRRVTLRNVLAVIIAWVSGVIKAKR